MYASKSVTTENRSKCVFYINYDSYGFYVEPVLGPRNHFYHLPLKRPSQEKNKNGIEETDTLLINDVTVGQAQDAQIQIVAFNKTGKLIPRSTICHITK